MNVKKLEVGQLLVYRIGDIREAPVPVYRVSEKFAFVRRLRGSQEIKLRREYVEAPEGHDTILVWPGSLCSKTNYWTLPREEQADDSNKTAEELRAELQHLKTRISGLWAIDKDPSEVSHEWIIQNAFKL